MAAASTLRKRLVVFSVILLLNAPYLAKLNAMAFINVALLAYCVFILPFGKSITPVSRNGLNYKYRNQSVFQERRKTTDVNSRRFDNRNLGKGFQNNVDVGLLIVNTHLTPKLSLCTPAEQDFYKFLNTNFSNFYQINCQVALNRLVDFNLDYLSQTDKSAFYRLFCNRSIDFVLTRAITEQKIEFFVAVELNDSSHENPERQKRDENVRLLLKKAQVPFVAISLSEYKNNPNQTRAALWRFLNCNFAAFCRKRSVSAH